MTDDDRNRGYYRPFGGGPIADDPPRPITQQLWWPLLMVPATVTGLVLAIVLLNEDVFDYVDSVVEFFFWPCLLAFAASMTGLSLGDRFTALGRVGLSSAAAVLTVAFMVLVGFSWFWIECHDGGCFG